MAHLGDPRRTPTARVAAIAVAAALIGSGVAGAAVGMASGSPPPTELVLASDEGSTTTSEAEATTTTEAGAATTTTAVEPTTTTTAPAPSTTITPPTAGAPDDGGKGPDPNGPAKRGLCRAFGSRTEMPGGSVAARNLVEAAATAGVTVREFCADVAKPGKVAKPGRAAKPGKQPKAPKPADDDDADDDAGDD